MGKQQLDIEAEKLQLYIHFEQTTQKKFNVTLHTECSWLKSDFTARVKIYNQKTKPPHRQSQHLPNSTWAVQVLEDKYSQGFEFFNFKIQNLLKKRSIIEELLKQTKCSVRDRQTTMKAIQKAEMRERREEYDMRLSLENPVQSRQRVQEIIKNSELRLNMIQSKIQTGIYQQDRILTERLKARKLKSESSNKDANELVEGYLAQKDRVKNCEQLQYKKNYIQIETEKTHKMAMRKKTSPHLFNSFSHIKF